MKLFRSNHTDHTDLWVFLKDCKCILKEVLIKDQSILMKIYFVFGVGLKHTGIVALCHGICTADRQNIDNKFLRNRELFDINLTLVKSGLTVGANNKTDFLRIHIGIFLSDRSLCGMLLFSLFLLFTFII